MENLISRYRNVTILAVMLFVQVLGLAVQVKRGGGGESTRLIRSWTVSAVTPLKKSSSGARAGWETSGTITFICAACGRKIAI